MKLVEDWKLALDADWKFNLGSYEKEKWAIEYRRIGRKYASWGAIFAIFGIPSILLSEMHNTYENPQLWLFYRMLPSVVIGIAFILLNFLNTVTKSFFWLLVTPYFSVFRIGLIATRSIIFYTDSSLCSSRLRLLLCLGHSITS
jgi:hypothetical protein